MVNTKIVSRFDGQFPTCERDSRKILGGPLYPVCEVLELLDRPSEGSLHIWTKKCARDLKGCNMDLDGARELLRIALQRGRFLGAEWCVQKPDGPWAACDAYSVFRREWIAAAYKDMDIEYYIKFAIGKKGKLLLLVSCHPSQDRS